VVCPSLAVHSRSVQGFLRAPHVSGCVEVFACARSVQRHI